MVARGVAVSPSLHAVTAVSPDITSEQCLGIPESLSI